MTVRKSPVLALLVVITGLGIRAAARERKAETAVAPQISTILWRNPADIESRNLFYGPGGERHEPPPGTFTYVEEDLGGSSPKFVVRDRYGAKWKVKLGIEARPETVATRLVWAAGYFTDQDYFLKDLHVEGLPERLHRGQEFVGPGGFVFGARLERDVPGEKKAGRWEWRHNPFSGSRELNGLRVLMSLINNWDVKDQNNAIRQKGDEQIFMVSDLGASFGAAARDWPRWQSKGDLYSYLHSRFVSRRTEFTVNFQSPGRPKFVYAVNPKEYFGRIRIEWIGRNIPIRDARWMGRLLACLSPRQIGDAFRAAGYPTWQVEAYSKELERRIVILENL